MVVSEEVLTISKQRDMDVSIVHTVVVQDTTCTGVAGLTRGRYLKRGGPRERIKSAVTGSASTGKVTYRGAAKGSAGQAYYRVIVRL